MPRIVWLNGNVMPLEDAVVPAADHAHLYGDGVFEGIRIYGRKVFRLGEHLGRLYDGCRYLGFTPPIERDEFRKIVLEVCAQADIDDGYIRINATRGTALGLDPKHVQTPPNLMVMVSTLGLYPESAYESGLDVVTTSFRTIAPDALDPRLKAIGRYASNIMAKAEANRLGAGEGLMLNPEGYVAECTGDNLFIVRGGRIRTPHPSCGILQGITRDTVIALLASEGLVVVEDYMTRYDVMAADEAFLTGTAAEVVPMVTLDGRPIGEGKPGPVTRRVMELFRAETKNGTPF